VPDSIETILQKSNVLQQVILPIEIDALLSALEPVDPGDPVGGVLSGDIRLSDNLSKSPIPGLDLALTAPTSLIKTAPFRLKLEGTTSFKFWLMLAKQGQVQAAFKLLDKIPGLAFTGATKTVAPDGREGLEALPAGDPKVRSSHCLALARRRRRVGPCASDLRSCRPACQHTIHSGYRLYRWRHRLRIRAAYRGVRRVKRRLRVSCVHPRRQRRRAAWSPSRSTGPGSAASRNSSGRARMARFPCP